MNAAVLSPVESLLEAAKRLTHDEQVDFLDRFAVMVNEDDQDVPLSPEWMAEIDRRVVEIEAGTCAMHDWQDVLQETRESLKRPA